jgi:hypothetical protein
VGTSSSLVAQLIYWRLTDCLGLGFGFLEVLEFELGPALASHVFFF